MTGREQGQSTARHARNLGYVAEFLQVQLLTYEMYTYINRSCRPCMVTRHAHSLLGRLLKAPKAETVSVAER